MIFPILLAVHILLALLLIGVILLQQGKGATAGAAFGSGASSTVFGARGSASFLTRLTTVLAILFFSNCMLLAYLYGQNIKPASLLDQVQTPAPVGAPPPGTAPPGTPPMRIDLPATDVPVTDVPVPDLPSPATSGDSAPAANTGAPPADVPSPAAAATDTAPANAPPSSAPSAP